MSASLVIGTGTRGVATPVTTELEVTVRGVQSETQPGPRDASIASATIPRVNLVAPGLQAQDVLRTQSGILVTETGGFGAPATASVRGGTAADTPVYLAGVRLNDDVGGTADLSTIPLWLIHHVEIYRGNAPLDADRAGPGGAIYFEPKRPTKRMGGVGYSGGAWGTSRGWAYHGERYGRASLLVGISAERAGNRYPFVNDEGKLLAPGERHIELRRNADERSVDLWAVGRAELGRGFKLDCINHAIEREQGVPRLALLQSYAARQKTSRLMSAWAVTGPIATAASIQARLSVLRGQVEFHDPFRELTLNATELSFHDWRLEQQLALRIDVADSVRLRPILDVAYEAIERHPSDVPIDGTHRTYARAGASAEVDVDAFSFRGTGAVECHHTAARSGQPCDALQPAARMNVEWRLLPNLRWFGNIGHYSRVPTLGELYGVSGVVHGNRALSAERGDTIDVGLRAATHSRGLIGKLYLDVFAFARAARGLIAYTRTGQGYVVPYNVDSARVTGIEFLLGARAAELVGLEVTGTLMDPRDTSKHRQAVNDLQPYRSRMLLSPRVRLDWKRSSAVSVSGAGVLLSALYQASRYADPAGLGVIGEQLSVDVESYLEWFDGLLTARARVADLFDARRTDVVGYPLPGRSVYLGIEAHY